RSLRFVSRSKQARSNFRTLTCTWLKSGSFTNTAARMSETVLPSNKRLPVTISNNTTPNAQISAHVHLLTAGLFGAHVRRCSQNDPLLRCRHAERRRVRRIGFAIMRERSRQTEVENLHLAVRCDFDVCRFQVSMNHALLVRTVDSVGDL